MKRESKISGSFNANSWRLVSWWKWMILGHCVFVAILCQRQFLDVAPLIRSVLHYFSLSKERNYAVWWSGICLFVAAILFYRCWSSTRDSARGISWIILSIFAMGLATDEIGSFHEMIIREYGFGGLLPIALVVGGSVCYSIFILFRNSHTHMSAILVSFAILCFFAVAGLEFVENRIDMGSSLIKPIRLVVEETIELAGTTLLIFAGLIALPLEENERPELVYICGSWNGLPYLNGVLLLLYLMHLLFYFGTLNFEIWSFRAGNPISVFPIIIFFLCSLKCIFQLHRVTGIMHKVLLLLSILLLLVSIGQTTNLAMYAGTLAGNKPSFLIDDLWSWLATLIPFTLLVLILLGQKLIRAVTWFSIGVVILIMFWAFTESPRIASYYLFSGTVAMACFILIRISSQDLFRVPARCTGGN